jgi:hypothetical protein
MKRLLLFAALSILPAFGQEQAATPPRVPVVVARLALQKQTQLQGSSTAPVAVFTPSYTGGLYRVTVAIQQTGSPLSTGCSGTPGLPCVHLNISYGLPIVEYLPYASFLYPVTGVFAGVAGQPIGFATFQFPGEIFAPYDLIIVVEEL